MSEDSEMRLEALQSAKSIVNDVKLTSQHSNVYEVSILIDLQLIDCSSDSPLHVRHDLSDHMINAFSLESDV